MDRPNVVFIIADQHRWDFVGYEGNGTTETPNLDRMAAAGVLFRSAYCPAPLCSPSREALTSSPGPTRVGASTVLSEEGTSHGEG